jgi:uncharacterized membrane protein
MLGAVILDATPLDVAALAWFLMVWLGYGRFADRIPGRAIGLNHHMVALRQCWMERMLERDNRIMDSQLIGHTIHSVTFFASTTMLVLAGLVGMFGALDHIYASLAELSFPVHTSREFFEAKMLLLLVLFVHGFFKFTWSLRQFNYLCALIGSTPVAPVAAAQRTDLASAGAAVLTEAVVSFNAGLRAYYFAIGVLAWFIQPWLFMALTAWMLAVLLNRQLRSPTFQAIDRQLGRLVDPAASPAASGRGPAEG